MEKYYAPNISEFHVGFEYEFKHSDYPENGWKKYDTPVVNVEYENCPFGCTDLSEYRVKCLDREDIESMDFIEVIHSYGSFYKKGNFTIEYAYDNVRIVIREIEEQNTTQLFQGVIKNKSELKVILKMLGI